jgi:hypothetical protein
MMNDPVVMRRVTGVLIILSVIEWIFATFFGLVNQVSYVSHLSQLAITISLIPWWQGLRVESRQVEDDIPNEVTDRLIERTTLESASSA